MQPELRISWLRHFFPSTIFLLTGDDDTSLFITSFLRASFGYFPGNP
nr:MAG TPA: hypothetical protein [Caudoviricetes sp.]